MPRVLSEEAIDRLQRSGVTVDRQPRHQDLTPLVDAIKAAIARPPSVTVDSPVINCPPACVEVKPTVSAPAVNVEVKPVISPPVIHVDFARPTVWEFSVEYDNRDRITKITAHPSAITSRENGK